MCKNDTSKGFFVLALDRTSGWGIFSVFLVISESGICLSLWSHLQLPCQFLTVIESYLINVNNFISVHSLVKYVMYLYSSCIAS